MSQKKFFSITKEYLPKLWYFYFIGLLFFILTTYLTLKVPGLTQQFIDGFFDKKDASYHKDAAIAIIIIGFVIMIVRSFSVVLILLNGRFVESFLRNHYFWRCMHISQDNIEKLKIGDLISRMSSDLRTIGFFYGFGIVQIFNFSLISFFAISNMLKINEKLTFFVLIPMAINILIMRFITPILFANSKIQQKCLAELSSKIAESFHNVLAIQTEAATNSFLKNIELHNKNLYKANIKQLVFRSTIMPLFNLLTGISYVIVFFYGGSLVMEGSLTIGQLSAFNANIALQSVPLFGISLFIFISQRALSASERIEMLDNLHLESDINNYSKNFTNSLNSSQSSQLKKISINNSAYSLDETNADKNKKNNQKITNKQIVSINAGSFSYKSSCEIIFKDINLSINQGQKIGLVGKIGCGKTTLFKILNKLYSLDSGDYYFLGKDTNDINIYELRDQVGWVSQQAQFFSESIAYNLSLELDQTIDRKKLLDVCKTVQIYDEVMSFENGIDSLIGENGVKLSGGQKQRLSLARSLLRDKKLYLLDDVFSALDYSTEKKIIEQLELLTASFLIITHRTAVLDICDDVYEIKNSKIYKV